MAIHLPKAKLLSNRAYFVYSDVLVRSSVLPLFSELSSDKIALAIRDYGYRDIRHGLKRTYEELPRRHFRPESTPGWLRELWLRDRTEDSSDSAGRFLLPWNYG